MNRLTSLCLAAACMLAAASGWAQPYPSRPVTMVVPQAVGGTNDIVARLIAQKLGDALPGSVVVENRPGAGGNIGTAHVAKADAQLCNLAVVAQGNAVVRAMGQAVHRCDNEIIRHQKA